VKRPPPQASLLRVIPLRSAALALVALTVVGCAPTASSPTPTVSASPTATTVAATPTALARIAASDAALPATAGAYVLFQLPSETGLRAISFGAEQTGILQGQVAQVGPGAGWSQSPYGVPYLVGSTLYDRDGKPLGTIPWSEKESKTWSSEGRFLCAAVPERATTGAQMRLEMAFVGQPAKLVAGGFATFSDNATHPVLACDQGTDRAIVAVFGQGVAPARLWVFRLSTGALIRSVDYGGAVRWVAANTDGSMLAESIRSGGTAGTWKATIRSADDGAELGSVDGYAVQGFSGDSALVVGANETSVAVIEWKIGRKVWSANGPYGGFLAEPAGRHLVVGTGFAGGSDVRDVYLTSPDGSAVLLPARVRVALRY
jgi:hypothetical protein